MVVQQAGDLVPILHTKLNSENEFLFSRNSQMTLDQQRQTM